ncbi:hypothetical protein BJX61DRAFT_542406 [Aspergillus egyptiacus]|nr:hypothetical protein BJX61DRAFT_542406 [Aspergillus egyptiacus]
MGSDSTIGWIWPKDPRPGNPRRWSKWSRLSDILKGKGPDIFVGRIRLREEHHHHHHGHHGRHGHHDDHEYDRHHFRRRRFGTDWSLWGREHLRNCKIRHCDDCDRIREEDRKNNIFPWARRDPEERYDFRLREYRVPDEGTWSWKVYCDEPRHVVPMRYWDRYGREYPSGYWHDIVHGKHGKIDKHGKTGKHGKTDKRGMLGQHESRLNSSSWRSW